MTTSEYTELWQMQDAITTVANANGYTVWELRMMDGCFHLELNTHLDEEKISEFCAQMPLPTDWEGEGTHGSKFCLYQQ